MNGPAQSGEPITAAGIEELKAELAELEGPRRQEMARRIKAARDEGDLKENAEYHTAKEDQAHMETRIKRLQERLQNAVVVEVDASSGDVFAFGRNERTLVRIHVFRIRPLGSVLTYSVAPTLPRFCARHGIAYPPH